MKTIFVIIVLFAASLQAQEEEKFLFVGNSFTFYWNLPSQVEKMGEQNQLLWNINQTTASGASLRDHWQGNKNLQTKALLSENFYDHVIFQEQSSLPLQTIDTTVYYFNQLKNLLPDQTKVYFYATWMYPNILPDSLNGKIENSIEKILQNNIVAEDVQLVRVGKAFEMFSYEYPEIGLFSDDDKHPSAAGTYLAACVFYATFSGQSSLGLERRFQGKDEAGKSIYYSMVEKHVAEACQKIADQVVFDENEENIALIN